MNMIIDESQSVFLPNRYILDNVVLSQEIIHYSKHNNQQEVVVKVDFEKAYDKIHWAYILEVLQGRGFSITWITWIYHWLISSQSCITVNGDLTSYFYYKRGVRQGDPLSPFLFILASDTLSKILKKGRQEGVIRGLGPACFNNSTITNCHYADDTILFLEAKDEIVAAAWWAMQAFEAMSGIKVNLAKTEMFGINVSNLPYLADTFQCKTAAFPMKYLGLPLHDTKLTISNWQFLLDKIGRKLQNWKEQILSIGGNFTLFNHSRPFFK